VLPYIKGIVDYTIGCKFPRRNIMSVTFDTKVANKYLSLKQSAKHRGKDFNLSLTSISNLARAKTCYYSGLPLTNKTRTIDRVNSDIGYVKGNVVACHVQINQLKANLDLKAISKLANKMEKHFNNK